MSLPWRIPRVAQIGKCKCIIHDGSLATKFVTDNIMTLQSSAGKMILIIVTNAREILTLEMCASILLPRYVAARLMT